MLAVEALFARYFLIKDWHITSKEKTERAPNVRLSTLEGIGRRKRKMGQNYMYSVSLIEVKHFEYTSYNSSGALFRTCCYTRLKRSLRSCRAWKTCGGGSHINMETLMASHGGEAGRTIRKPLVRHPHSIMSFFAPKRFGIGYALGTTTDLWYGWTKLAGHIRQGFMRKMKWK